MADRGVTVLSPALPRGTRLRLAITGRIDDAAYWLVCHDHCAAAIRLYRICGMW